MPSIPQIIRTPFVALDVDSSRAVGGLQTGKNRLLVIGMKLAAGTATVNVPTPVNSVPQAEVLSGRGSQAAAMLAAVKRVNPLIECYAIFMVEPSGGTKASGTITITGPATAAGEIAVYIAGKRLAVSVANGDSASTIAAAINAAINADTSLPVTSTVALGVVTITANWKGASGNYINICHSYNDGEAVPAGVTIAIVAMASGAGAPDMASALAAMGDVQYHTLAIGETDSTSLGDVEDELETRFGPMVQKEGLAFAAGTGTHSTLVTLGTGENSKQLCIMGAGKSPTPPWVWAATVAAVDAGEPDPARPRQTLPLPGCLPPLRQDRFTRAERDILLGDGVSTYVVDDAGNVTIERLVTTYQTNTQGFSDVSYMDVTTMRTLAFLRATMRARIALRFPRQKLADDGTNFAPGQPIVTPSVIKGELILLFREWEAVGLVEGFDQFKSELDVTRDGTDRNRVNVVMGPNLLNSFIVLAGTVQFIL